ncbi:TPA: DUF1642 domain-containing protein [Streptococcus pyogenes]|uniref:DUF1642 domain-containing protein n=1 Tax=Streptococcus TaxID=1301 RepID=UPI0010C36A52|nr:DUF1642 domain-containing protein [Streptococcus canis]QBX22588.1 hypothetical protein Javan87_0033 [Streptococcus phage Javan87]QBX32026.1 hypothetical protein Javan90_0032 [Streptococcus phage Javan90]HER5315468.1 DUF1642 domain-containing protein [Streptococcus pyogenes]MDV5994459.1 DUF1642 domain-containing protein [Streptococcus canis]HER5531123.1 DUF1642 domain-containing protein [Streptococcus pyogenes]
MNIEEAKRKLHNMAYRDLQTKPYDLKLADVMQILNQIEFDQPKLEVSREVADWIETVKILGFDLYELLEGPADNSLEEWLTNEDNQELIVKARLFGYTIEKEKLYTVDLPNGQPLVRTTNTLYFSQILAAENAQLTEQEIRKDFDWAWQFAEEVTLTDL